MADRYHRAARDGILDLLKEANRKDCNSRDDDGMTPTLWAVFEGNLEALRLLVGRGGDPEKCDHYGNAALHFAAARGHMNCVTFLLNYGVNLYAKDIDHHTAKDLAAMNDHQDILRLLDDQAAKEARKNPKKVQTQMEKATKEADKRVKEFAQVQEKARKLAEKEKKRLEKERQRMEQSGHNNSEGPLPSSALPRASMAALNLRRDSRLVYGQSPKFSDLVNQTKESDKIKLPVSAVYKKVQQQRKKMMGGKETGTLSKSSSNVADDPNEFKVGAIEDGKRSVRSISGLRRDSEIMYVPKYDEESERRTGIDEIFGDSKQTFSKSAGSMGRNKFQNDFTHSDSGYGDEEIPLYQPPRASIFERPGFGGLAFRNSITALAENSKAKTEENGSAKNQKSAWDNDELESDDGDDEDNNLTPMHFFLSAVGLEEFIEPFVNDKFDLDSLMLVTESDLVAMNIPRGHRLKLMRAISERKAALEEPGEVEDSHL